MIPLLRTLKSSSPADLRADLVAGLTTAVMLVPQGMAYAMLAGLEPIVGLYASTLPLAVYALFGSSRPLAVGPVAMDSLMVAAGLLPFVQGGTAEYAIAAAALAGMIGLFQLAMGALRAGFLVRFLGPPVILGFTAAAAVLIGLSQLKSALGVELPRSQQVHVVLGALLEQAPHIHILTLGLSLGSLGLLVFLKRRSPRFPRFLVVVLLGTVAVAALGLDGRGVAIVGDVPAGLPSLSWPGVDAAMIANLVPIAFAIALVAMMESISVAKRYELDEPVDANRELLALGAANLTSSVIGGYVVTGGFSRTAVNAQAGARSPLAGLVTAGAVALTLLFLTDGFYFLPKAVLAAIIISAVAGLVDVAGARALWRVDRVAFAVAAFTFLATLSLGIQLGMALGVAAGLVARFARRDDPAGVLG